MPGLKNQRVGIRILSNAWTSSGGNGVQLTSPSDGIDSRAGQYDCTAG